jgi:endonuclease/exonuclease/phosphatase family metal-dependent hydrolase
MKLLTWNVQWCRGVDGVVNPERIAAEARRLADFDVACFQEVAVNFPELAGSAGEDQPTLLSKHLVEYSSTFAAGVDVPGEKKRKQFGNLMLSRLPMKRILRHSLPWPAAPDVPAMPRVALEAVVEAPFGALRIITTHLEYYSKEHRALQIDRLGEVHREALAERLDVQEPGSFHAPRRPASAIVCGDFNLPPHDSLHPRMLGHGFIDAWEVLNPGKPHPPTFRLHEASSTHEPYCCDFVFVTPDLVPRLRSIAIDAATQASDHQPVIVDLG